MLPPPAGWLIQSMQDGCEKRFFAVLDACDKPAWVDLESLALVFASAAEARTWADANLANGDGSIVQVSP